MNSAYLRLADDVLPSVPVRVAPARRFRAKICRGMLLLLEDEVARLHLMHRGPVFSAAMLRTVELPDEQRRGEARRVATLFRPPWEPVSFLAPPDLVEQFRSMDREHWDSSLCAAVAGVLGCSMAMTPDHDVPLCGTLAALRRLEYWTEGKPWRPQPWPADLMPEVRVVAHRNVGDNCPVVGRIGFSQE